MVVYFRLIVFFCLFCPTIGLLHGQAEANQWFFGNKASIDFYTGNPRAMQESAMYAPGGCSSIADSAGNLLFYTNGQKVWNAAHQLMLNGDGLKGNFLSTQSCLIVPKPGSSVLYYIFTTDKYAYPQGFQYSVVDMALDGGLGGVATKNTPITTPVTEKLAAVKHGNGKDYWILAHEWDSDVYLCYLLTENGFADAPVVSHAGVKHENSLMNAAGAMKFSPDGKWVAAALRYDDYVDWLAFNDTTGQLTLKKTFNKISNPYGVEFSPDGTKLYVTGFFFPDILRCNTITQIDLAPPVPVIYAIDSVYIEAIQPDVIQGGCQLAPDGRIYFARRAAEYLGVIDNPNAIGAAANYQANGFSLIGKRSDLNLPNTVASFVKPPVVEFAFPNTICLDQAGQFTGLSNPEPESWSWEFGDPASGDQNQSNLQNPQHLFSKAGQFKVKLSVVRGGKTYAVEKFVDVFPRPVDNLGEDQILCRGQQWQLDAGNPGATYFWSNGLTVRSFNTDLTNTYNVLVSYGNCTELFSVDIRFVDGPQPDLGPDTSFCGVKTYQLDAGNEGAQYLWNTGETTRTISPTKSGVYSVIVNFGTCTGWDTMKLDLFRGVFVELGNVKTLCGDYGEEVTLDAGSGAGYLYHWRPTGDFTQKITVKKEGFYSVMVIDPDGCYDSDTVEVQVDCFNLPAPNAFSPNGDGNNDVFLFQGIGIRRFELRIFNRGGREIFFSNDINVGWDGKHNGVECPEGAYVYEYRLNASLRGHEINETRDGSVMLVR